MPSVRDFIFGDQDNTKGLKFQRESNERAQQFAQESGRLARQDVLDILPRGQESLQQGYRAAIDVATRTPFAQSRTLQGASQRAQEALLRGQDEYRRAIMGMPSMLNENGNFYANPLGFAPQRIAASAQTDAMNPFYASQRPLFLGSQQQDVEEMRMRRNDPLNFWQLASPNKDVNLFPEQFRDGVYNDDPEFWGGVTYKGGAGSTPVHFASTGTVPRSSVTGNPSAASLYSAALSGQLLQMPWGQAMIPNWSNV